MAKAPAKLPTGIDRLRSGKYRARIYVDGRQHTLGSFHTLGDARAALDIARGEKARGTFTPPDQQRVKAREKKAAPRGGVTVADVAAEWLAWGERVGRTRRTIEAYRHRLDLYILPAFGPRPIADVTVHDVDAWHEDLVNTRGPGAARAAYLALSALFTYARGKAREQRRDFTPYVSESPCQVHGAAAHTAVRKVDREVATPEEVEALASYMPPQNELAVLLAAWCGLRRGEVLALRRKHLEVVGDGDDAQWWIKVERQLQRERGGGVYETSPKSEAGARYVPIPPRLIPLVQRHLDDDAGPGRDGLLFPRRRRGADFTAPETFAYRFREAVKEFNADRAADDLPTLDGFTFHMLRHTALTRIGERGATLEELRAFAGHASWKVVQRYQHASRDRLAALAREL
ncbi:site-specific integrase [Micrococcus sp. EYE_162]|uniref:tyrosine-type recombinase/integrase n=1 Tax=unclassified Micrococcus TaxID=2620948 RepID=UPI002002CC21|nr:MULTISPECIES: site-specific integrase [unclassified Micrococcus]MCK6096162.1 site-specific integrase [Micrococcus sp. EYE_212]MCK6172253.1 site-specific integrase [Micrococcus sp. EYE_162]